MGIFVAPLPMGICWAAYDGFTNGVTHLTAVLVVVAYFLVWIPLILSRIFLRLMAWGSRRAHLVVMFTITFLPMLSVYKFAAFRPDATLSYEINEGGKQVVEFAVAGVVLAAFVALINAVCMLIYWLVVHQNRIANASRQ